MTTKEETAALKAIALDTFCQRYGFPVTLAGEMSDAEGSEALTRVREEAREAGQKLAEDFLKTFRRSAAT